MVTRRTPGTGIPGQADRGPRREKQAGQVTHEGLCFVQLMSSFPCCLLVSGVCLLTLTCRLPLPAETLGPWAPHGS